MRVFFSLLHLLATLVYRLAIAIGTVARWMFTLLGFFLVLSLVVLIVQLRDFNSMGSGQYEGDFGALWEIIKGAIGDEERKSSPLFQYGSIESGNDQKLTTLEFTRGLASANSPPPPPDNDARPVILLFDAKDGAVDFPSTSPEAIPDLLTLSLVAEYAAKDQSVRGVVFDLSRAVPSASSAQDVYNILQRLSNAGKKIWIHLSPDTVNAYNIATAADEIWVDYQTSFLYHQPGFLQTSVHRTELMDHYDLEQRILTSGDMKGYKSAYLLPTLAPNERRQIISRLQSDFDHFATLVSDGRGVSSDDLLTILNRSPLSTDEAISLGMIDNVGDFDTMVSNISLELTGTPISNLLPGDSPDQPIRLIDVSHYANTIAQLEAKEEMPEESSTEDLPLIAVLSMAGDITDYNDSSEYGTITPQQYLPIIKTLAQQENVSAVVVRLDSGGGDARAAWQIYQALTRLRTTKPVVISVGDVAASGGMLIAAGGSEIVAMPSSMLGSIGVVALDFGLAPMAAKLGLTASSVKIGNNADIHFPLINRSDEQQDNLETLVQILHKDFQNIISSNRPNLRDPDLVFKAPVFSGTQAKELGLVDQLISVSRKNGNQQHSVLDAIDRAVALANIDSQYIRVAIIQTHDESDSDLSFLPLLFASTNASLDPDWVAEQLLIYEGYSAGNLKIDTTESRHNQDWILHDQAKRIFPARSDHNIKLMAPISPEDWGMPSRTKP